MNEPKKKVLIVDDDLGVLKLYRRMLAGSFELLVTPTGYELETLVNHFTPDLIIMDLTLPEDHGRDLCVRLRKHEEYNRIAILVLSGLDETTVVDAAIQGGADGYMTKPFDIHILQTTINLLIASRQQDVEQNAPANAAP